MNNTHLNTMKQPVSHFRHIMPRFVLLCLLTTIGLQRASGQDTYKGLDFFCGVDFNLRDISYERQYDLLLNLTPGFKWNMGKYWQLAGQIYVPVINQFGDQYAYIRPSMFVLSKQMRLGNLYCKASAGLFSHYRYGVDLKAFMPMTNWFAFEAQAGYVGMLYTSKDWWIGRPDRLIGTVGGDIYLSRWNTQLRGVVGKYLQYHEYGCMAEAMRHFNHTTVSLYATWSSIGAFDGGFRVIVMLPPYHRKHRLINFRPASNLRISYSVMANPFSNVIYKTDPEENERDGWFSRDLLKWGSHLMEPDFKVEEKQKVFFVE